MMIFESLYFWITLVIFLYLTSIYWIVPKIENLEGNALKALNSLVSGATIAFLFLYVLPDAYVVFNYVTAYASENHAKSKEYVGYLISIMFLMGFSLQYIVEKISQKRLQYIENFDEDKNHFETFAFYLTMSIGMLFHFCIMFVLPSVVTVSLPFTVFFMMIIGAQFFLDQHIQGGYFQDRHQNIAKILLNLSLLTGWIMGLFLMHQEKPLAMTLMGALITGVLFMSFVKIELRSYKKQQNMFVFLSSLTLTSILIVLVSMVEKKLLW